MPQIRELAGGIPPYMIIVCPRCGASWKQELKIPELELSATKTEIRPTAAKTILDKKFDHIAVSIEYVCSKCGCKISYEIAVYKMGAVLDSNSGLEIDENWNKKEITEIVG